MSDETTFTLTMSPTIGALAAAMAKAQAEMSPAAKDSQNPHFRSSYASLASCVEACKPLNRNGIAVFQPPVPAGPDGVTVVTMLVHSSGEWMRGELYMPAAKRDPQGFGSALTYARRYCLCSTANLATDDDDGNEGAKTKPGPAKAELPAAKAPVPDLKVYASLCDQVDAGEASSHLDAAAFAAGKARKAGTITEAQFEQIKGSVLKKRASLGATANGGAP